MGGAARLEGGRSSRRGAVARREGGGHPRQARGERAGAGHDCGGGGPLWPNVSTEGPSGDGAPRGGVDNGCGCGGGRRRPGGQQRVGRQRVGRRGREGWGMLPMGGRKGAKSI